MDHMHIGGVSNGGMFSWYLAATTPDFMGRYISRISLIRKATKIQISGFASMNPVAGSPLIGFGSPPEDIWEAVDFSIIDFHGLIDDTIPYNEDSSNGIGPHGSLISHDGYYYEDKITLLNQWAEAMHCTAQEEDYPTDFDGVNGFKCWVRACANDNSLVRCIGDYGHDYPLRDYSHKAAAEVAWQFMKAHPKT